jgi:hypothetical protein
MGVQRRVAKCVFWSIVLTAICFPSHLLAGDDPWLGQPVMLKETGQASGRHEAREMERRGAGPEGVRTVEVG